MVRTRPLFDWRTRNRMWYRGRRQSPEPGALGSRQFRSGHKPKGPRSWYGISKKMFWRKHPWIDFTGRTGIRFCDQNRIAIYPERFSIAIMIAIAFSKSGSDCEMKIADRFSYENRDPISCSVCTCGPKTGFQSRSDLKMKIADRFYRENRDPVAK